MAAVTAYQVRLEERVLRPMVRPGPGWYLLSALLFVVVAWGVLNYVYQLQAGLVVTAMRDRIFWGIYVANFIFFLGISMAGTFISGVLRATQAGWRTPVTRLAEVVTLIAIMVGAIMPVVWAEHPDRIFRFIVMYGRWQSPIVWDFLAISTYIVASSVYLFLPLVPDLAIARDRLRGRGSALRLFIYRAASLGWRDTARQHRLLKRAVTIMMLMVIPTAALVHTVVSWIFAVTLREPWDTALFGIFFVVGAVFSGVAVLILLMAALRRVYHLEEYFQPKHFIYMGYMLAAAAAVMLYFNVNEYLVAGYKANEEVSFHYHQMFRSEFAALFWFYIIGGLVIPVLLIAWPRTRTIGGIVVASLLVVTAMWIERYFLVVASLRIPQMYYEPSNYAPTFVEVSIVAATFAAFGLGVMLFLRAVPIISIWEQVEQHEIDEAHAAAMEQLSAQRAPEPAPGGGGS